MLGMLSLIRTLCFLGVIVSWVHPCLAAEPDSSPTPSMAEILAASKPGDWRSLDPENTLYLELKSGRVVMELTPAFAPNHVANVKALVRERYFDGLAIIRLLGLAPFFLPSSHQCFPCLP